MGALFAEIENLQTGRSRCPLKHLIDSMSADDAADLDAALNNPRITGANIGRVLAKHEWAVSGPAVQNHRAGRCSCARVSR